MHRGPVTKHQVQIRVIFSCQTSLADLFQVPADLCSKIHSGALSTTSCIDSKKTSFLGNAPWCVGINNTKRLQLYRSKTACFPEENSLRLPAWGVLVSFYLPVISDQLWKWRESRPHLGTCHTSVFDTSSFKMKSFAGGWTNVFFTCPHGRGRCADDKRFVTFYNRKMCEKV